MPRTRDFLDIEAESEGDGDLEFGSDHYGKLARLKLITFTHASDCFLRR